MIANNTRVQELPGEADLPEPFVGRYECWMEPPRAEVLICLNVWTVNPAGRLVFVRCFFATSLLKAEMEFADWLLGVYESPVS